MRAVAARQMSSQPVKNGAFPSLRPGFFDQVDGDDVMRPRTIVLTHELIVMGEEVVKRGEALDLIRGHEDIQRATKTLERRVRESSLQKRAPSHPQHMSKCR
jgi:hypothetical protein